MSAWELTNATALLVLPPGGLIVLGLIGLALVRIHARLGATLAGFALLALYVFSTPIVGRTLLQALEEPYSDPAARSGAAAIVVLGGGSYPGAPEYGSDTVSAHTLERVRYAAHLHARTGQPVLVSGGNPARSATSEAEQMKAALRDFGVSTKWVEGESDNTYENALLSRRTLKPEGVHTVYLVTHAWHMRRARMAFVQSGFDVVPAATGYKSRNLRRGILDFMPSASALRDSFFFFHEVVGMAWYRLRFVRDGV